MGQAQRGTGSDGRRGSAPRADAWLLAVITGALYGMYAVLQWRRLEVPSWDLGIFTQLAERYAHLQSPIVPIKGEGVNLLGDHFHPALVLLGPLYRMFPSGLTLLVLQAVLVALSVVPLTRVAQEVLGRGWGLALGAAYAGSWGLQGAVAAQFHEIALAVPLLACALAAFLRSRWWTTAAWAAPLVLVKEDLGLTVAVLGAVLAWRARGDRPPDGVRAGAALALWGIGWFALTTLVLLPALNPRGRWDYTENLGGGDGGPVGLLVELVTPHQKVVTVLLLVALGGVVALRSPLVLLVVPTLAWRFLGDVPHYWGWAWHYSAVLMPAVVAALLDAGRAEATARPGRTSWRWARPAVGISLATTVLLLPTMPLARLTDAEAYRLPDRHGAAMAVLAEIEEGSTVATDIALMAYLVPTATVFWVGNDGNPAPDAVVIDTRSPTWGAAPPRDAARHAERRHPGTTYETVLEVSGYLVAQRTDGR